MVAADTILRLSETHPVLVYDGVCLLCDGYVQWLLARDKAETFRYVALQDAPQVKELLPTTDNDTVVLIHRGTVYTHSDVALLVAKLLPYPWRLLSVFILFPKGLRDMIYRLVARYRYRWFGRSDQCILPAPAKRHLFVKA